MATHGLTNHPLYQLHRSLMRRCYDEAHRSFPYYGARGVTVDANWHDVRAFCAWMDANMGPARSASVDRIDRNRGYVPGNVQWSDSTPAEETPPGAVTSQRRPRRRGCSFRGCDNEHHGRGLCSAHNYQLAAGRELAPLKRSRGNSTCTYEGCGRPHKGHGLCVGHLNLKRAGKPLRPLRAKSRPSFERTCSVQGCLKKHDTNGLCGGHNAQRVRNQPLTDLRQQRDPICTFDGCERPHQAHGYCKGHNAQLDRGEDLRQLFTRTCRDCAASFVSVAAVARCPDCSTYPADIRRRYVREARRGWTTDDYENRRAWVTILKSDPCSYCGAPVAGEVDHIEPLHLRGGDQWRNLTASCRSCNGSKAHRPLLVFMLERVASDHRAAAS